MSSILATDIAKHSTFVKVLTKRVDVTLAHSQRSKYEFVNEDEEVGLILDKDDPRDSKVNIFG